MADEILTEKEIEKLIEQLARGQKEFTEDDADEVIKWAKRILIQKALLDFVLDGKLMVCLKNGEVYFQKEPGKW